MCTSNWWTLLTRTRTSLATTRLISTALVKKKKKKKNFVFFFFLVCFLWFVCLCAFTEAIESLLEQWRAVRGLGEEIWENQRGVKGVFASKNLTPAERGPYSTRDGKTVSFRFDRVFQHF
jgi:hypothetical protein